MAVKIPIDAEERACLVDLVETHTLGEFLSAIAMIFGERARMTSKGERDIWLKRQRLCIESAQVAREEGV